MIKSAVRSGARDNDVKNYDIVVRKKIKLLVVYRKKIKSTVVMQGAQPQCFSNFILSNNGKKSIK